MEPMFVKVHKERGAAGLWKITGKDNRHYDLKHTVTGEKLHLYIAHTFQDQETKLAGFAARKAMADTFGNKLKKQGKRSS